jgi:hypothetical protein
MSDDRYRIVDKDDDIEYEKLVEHLSEDSDRKKKKTVLEIEEMGEGLLIEIDRKRKKQRIIQNKLIPYILKKSNDKYTKEELDCYSFEDVMKIYDEIKTKHSLFTKIFRFIFNI